MGHFINNEELVVEADNMFRVYEARTGKLVREGKHKDFAGILVAPGGKHLVYSGPKGAYLFDLAKMQELQAWEGASLSRTRCSLPMVRGYSCG